MAIASCASLAGKPCKIVLKFPTSKKNLVKNSVLALREYS